MYGAYLVKQDHFMQVDTMMWQGNFNLSVHVHFTDTELDSGKILVLNMMTLVSEIGF
jgi:hypothetical protein